MCVWWGWGGHPGRWFTCVTLMASGTIRTRGEGKKNGLIADVIARRLITPQRAERFLHFKNTLPPTDPFFRQSMLHGTGRVKRFIRCLYTVPMCLSCCSVNSIPESPQRSPLMRVSGDDSLSDVEEDRGEKIRNGNNQKSRMEEFLLQAMQAHK